MNNQLIITLFACCLLACNTPAGGTVEATETTLPFFNSADFTPEWIAEGTPEYARIHTIAPFALANQAGDTVTNATFMGKIYVANFFFTSCPGICPRLTESMALVQAAFKDDPGVLLLSHTVLPAKDSVPVLREYAINHDVIPGKWHLVTGSEDEIYALARHAYFADEDFVKTKDESAFVHTENVVLVDGKGRIRGVYNGTLALEMKRLIRHIGLLKAEPQRP